MLVSAPGGVVWQSPSMRVLCLDADLGLDADSYSFGSSVSLFDYDVVFWDPKASLEGYRAQATSFQGRTRLSESRSAAIVRDVARRRAEFKEFVELGRCLVVFLPGDTAVFIDSGERRYSGTGKNRSTTVVVTEFEIMKALPAPVTRQPGSGLEIVAANEVMASLFRQTSDDWAYRCVIEAHEQIRPLLHVKGTNKLVGGMIRTKKSRGLLLLLPELFIDDPNDERFDHSPLADDEQGSAEASKDTPRSNPGDLLLLWIESLMAEPEAELPPWAAEHQFPTEKERQTEQEQVEEDLAKLLSRLDVLKAAQAQDERWKTLITGSGAALERQVRDAFEVLGFQVQEAEPGRSDLRLSYGETLVVVEVKGVTKSAAEKHAAQLEKWVSEELASGRSAKGILVVNTWRERPVDQRDEVHFPDQMLAYSAQRGHCLLTGLQLLAIARSAMEQPGRRAELAELLIGHVGPLTGWDDPSAVFVSGAPAEVRVGGEEVEDLTSGGEIEGESPPRADT